LQSLDNWIFFLSYLTSLTQEIKKWHVDILIYRSFLECLVLMDLRNDGWLISNVTA
jgi:hypothetical protein